MAVQDPRERFGAVWQSPHANERWHQRTGGRIDEELLARWGEAVPVETPQAPQWYADARVHIPTDTLLIARFGEIQTVLDVAASPDHIEAHIREQL